MRVLGVDPGLTRCGVAVVTGAPGRTMQAEFISVITTPASDSVDLRLMALEQRLVEIVERFTPDVVAVERVFSQHNVRTAMATAQAAAIALVVAARAGIPVEMHTPSEVKAAVSGNGRADKAQVTAMVTRILNLSEGPRPADAADAAAIAITQAWRGTAQRRLSAQVGR